MPNQAGLSCCVDLRIRLCDNHYHADLLVDGISRMQLVFQSELLLTAWVAAIFRTVNVDLYVHLRSIEASYKHRVVDLSHSLSLQGMMVGITGKNSFFDQKSNINKSYGGNTLSSTAES